MIIIKKKMMDTSLREQKLPYYLLDKITFYLYLKYRDDYNIRYITNLRLLCHEYRDIIDKSYRFVRYENQHFFYRQTKHVLNPEHMKYANNDFPMINNNFPFTHSNKCILEIEYKGYKSYNDLYIKLDKVKLFESEFPFFMKQIYEKQHVLGFLISQYQYQYLLKLFNYCDPFSDTNILLHEKEEYLVMTEKDYGNTQINNNWMNVLSRECESFNILCKFQCKTMDIFDSSDKIKRKKEFVLYIDNITTN